MKACVDVHREGGGKEICPPFLLSLIACGIWQLNDVKEEKRESVQRERSEQIEREGERERAKNRSNLSPFIARRKSTHSHEYVCPYNHIPHIPMSLWFTHLNIRHLFRFLSSI